LAGEANAPEEIIILERYRLLRKLGAGGMGAVFEVEHIHLGTKHAAKALQINAGATLSDEQQRAVEERFLREAKICASVRHPNLVSVTDFGSSNGVPYIVMDFIDGEDVQKILDSHGALDSVSSLKITRDVAGAMGALHDRGIIHRDLKPANIMIERESGRVLLTDLGIAKDTESGANLTQGILGTPAYMAPEQMIDTSKTTPESDIYSLGVVMYAMLTGKDPFTGENPFAILQQAREKLATKYGLEVYFICEEVAWASVPEPSRLRAFDAVMPYAMIDSSIPFSGRYPLGDSIEGILSRCRGWRNVCLDLGIDFIPSVMPGYDDKNRTLYYTLINGTLDTPAPVVERSPEDFRELCTRVQELIDPEVLSVFVTSWNEWFEGTTVLPLHVDIIRAGRGSEGLHGGQRVWRDGCKWPAGGDGERGSGHGRGHGPGCPA